MPINCSWLMRSAGVVQIGVPDMHHLLVAVKLIAAFVCAVFPCLMECDSSKMIRCQAIDSSGAT